MGRLGVSDICPVRDRGLVMWKCEMCGSVFSEPDSIEYCPEDYYGVSSMFPNRNTAYYDACPECGSEEIHSYCEDEDETEGAIWED